jgi:hypothetical protein
MRISLFLLVLGLLSTGRAQVINAWTNATSSYWEYQTNWSLGILPNQSQSVSITNAGWKAVAIGPNTAQNFPQSMQIQDLQIASPTNSFNVLLMNFSGFKVPLMTTSLTVGSNSSVVVQSSSLETGGITLAGTISQGDFSQVNDNGAMFIRNRTQYASDVAPPGVYFLTNGTLSVAGGVSLGDFSGRGQFVQYGGNNNIGGVMYQDDYGHSASLYVGLQGEYDLYGGQLTPTNGIMVGSGDYAGEASFYQYGGSVNADMAVNGNYILKGGIITGHMQVVAQNSYQRVDATLLQTGGTNHAISLDLGYPNRFGGAAYYTLSNGVIQADSAVSFNGGKFSQYNGQFTIVSNLVMHGGTGGLDPSADYLLAGGRLSVAGLTVGPEADFSQTGGTNLIAGALVIGPIPPSQFSWYTLSGGTLNVQDIKIGANAFFQHTSGNIGQSGVLTLTQGEWRAANGDYALGPLALGAPDMSVIGYHTNSAIIFPNGSSTLRLANSSAQAWAANAIFYITNWHGSVSGGGATQLYFGSNSSGLTTAQLARTTFSNPAGFSPGNYGAQLLSTGELVPVAQPTLQTARYGSVLVLTWPGGYQLRSATNITGPWTPVSGATSPWTNHFDKPQEFFRLQSF